MINTKNMTINVQLQYCTEWGESVQLRIGKRRIVMDYSFGGLWQIMLTGRELHDGDDFSFEVIRDGKVVKREWRTHHFKAPVAQKNIIVRSRWQERPSNSAFFSSAFSDVIFRRPSGASFRKKQTQSPDLGNIYIRIAVPEVRKTEPSG